MSGGEGSGPTELGWPVVGDSGPGPSASSPGAVPRAASAEFSNDDFEPLGVGSEPATTGPMLPAGGSRRPLYRADPDRILRILSANQFEDAFLAFRELYANALDAVRGRREPRIELRAMADRVIVEDNGTGLDEPGLDALTTLGKSTRRGRDAIGRFGIGFASVFDPVLGVARVEFRAARFGRDSGVLIRFFPDVSGGVSIEVEDSPPPRLGGSRVEVTFDATRAPEDRVARVTDIFETHAAYSGVQTELNGRLLGRDLSDYIKTEIRNGEWSPQERALVAASAVKGPVGVAAIDPARSDSKFRAYQRGLFVCELPLNRVPGKPWPRGVFGAISAEGLDLVASRNAFVEDERFDRFQRELRRLACEAAYRVVRHYEQSEDAYARIVLLDSIRRGLRSATPESLLVESDDLFSGAVVRSPLFRAWFDGKRYSFEELVALKEADTFRALSYRPAWRDRDGDPIMRADDSIERDVFRKLSGMRDMPAAARAEDVAQPSLLSRIRDRLLSGPRAEYSLFQREVPATQVAPGSRALIAQLQAFMATPEVGEAIARLLPGPLPRLGFGLSRNAFGPVAAYRAQEIRFNVGHRTVRRLSRHPDPKLACRALLPVLAHELAHMCHELHDIDFYRTSRALLRALTTAAARIDANAHRQEAPTMGVRLGPEPTP